MTETLLIDLECGKIRWQDAYNVITAVAERRKVRLEGDSFYLNMTPGKRKRYILTMGTPEVYFHEATRDKNITVSAYSLELGGYSISYKEE